MTSRCAFCKSTRFKLEEVSPEESRYKFYFVQCSSCGSPVGITQYYNTHDAIKQTDSKIQKLENKIDNLESFLRQALNILVNRR